MNQHLTEQQINEEGLDEFPVVEASIFSSPNKPIIIGRPDTYQWVYDLPAVGLHQHAHPDDLRSFLLQTTSLKNLPGRDDDIEEIRSYLRSSTHFDPLCKVVVRDPEEGHLSLIHVYQSLSFDYPTYFTLENGIVGVYKETPIFPDEHAVVLPPDYDQFLELRNFLIDALIMMANDPILLMQFLGTSWEVCESMYMDPELWEFAISMYKEWYK